MDSSAGGKVQNVDAEGYCPVHHIKCNELSETKNGVKDLQKSKLSVTMFRIFLGLAIVIIGAVTIRMENSQSQSTKIVMQHLSKTTEQLSNHVKKSNVIFYNITHSLNEVALNQRKTMKKIDLEFDEIPDYDRPHHD